MKRTITLIALLMCICQISFALGGEDISNYKLKEYNYVEEFQAAYMNKILTYVPITMEDINDLHVNYMRPQSGFGNELKMKRFLVTNITGKSKLNRDWQEMEWTIEEVDGNERKTFKVYSGNYPKYVSIYSESEYLFKNLQLFMLEGWKEDHKSEIGRVFENPMVKARYEVTDVYLSIEKDIVSESLLKMYTVRNTITGETFHYNSERADFLCFKDDLSGSYYTYLARVEKPENPSVQYGNTTIIEDEGKTKFSYKDNYIDIIIFGTSTKFFFTLKNVSENTLKLVWDEAVFVDYNGSTSRIMHNGIKYSEREASQPASTIIRGASLDDMICPTANVYWHEYRKEWDLHLIYPDKVSMETKQVQLMLPIQIKDVVNEYIFVFDIKYQYNHPERLNLP